MNTMHDLSISRRSTLRAAIFGALGLLAVGGTIATAPAARATQPYIDYANNLAEPEGPLPLRYEVLPQPGENGYDQCLAQGLQPGSGTFNHCVYVYRNPLTAPVGGAN